jgi:hypothetical protein
MSVIPTVRQRALAVALPLVVGLPLVVLCGVTGSRAQGVCSGVTPINGATLSSFSVVTGLPGRPLLLTAAPGDRDRLFVVEQAGRVRIHKRGDAPGVNLTFLDITDRVQASPILDEMGLLGLVFDPDYDTNGFLYVNYTEGGLSAPWNTVLSRFSRSDADPDAADPDSEMVLLRFSQPQSNHNGGHLFFGNDGFLYVASGDGGGGGDNHGTCGNGQNKTNLLGKMLRLDVRNIDPLSVPPDCGGPTGTYRIPSTNPYALTSTTECGEIYVFGLRNPWRSAIDSATGDLYIADVGQNCYEEISFLPSGTTPPVNLGWRSMEGKHCFNPAQPQNCNAGAVTCSGVPTCNDPALVQPVLEYPHAEGCSITGGPVYRGCQMPDLAGRYFYGDYCAGFVKSFRMVGGAPAQNATHTPGVDPGMILSGSLTSFGLDAEGELYIVDRGGTVLRVGPRFIDLEVSGPGGAPFLLDAATWSWRDLFDETMRPVSFYRVYRGTPGGTFQCRITTPVPEWPGGDPDVPAPGTFFAYVITAVSPTGEETRPGITGASFLLAGCP